MVQPRGLGWGEMNMDVLLARQPAIVFGFMGVQIIQNDVQLAAGIAGDETVHEVQKLDPPTVPVMTGFNQQWQRPAQQTRSSSHGV